MRRLSTILVTFAVLGAASAQARPSTLQMSCAQAQALVASRGAVVLTTGAHTFDRFVRDWRYCATSEYADPAAARTADNPSCNLFYVCRSRPAPLDDLFDRF